MQFEFFGNEQKEVTTAAVTSFNTDDNSEKVAIDSFFEYLQKLFNESKKKNERYSFGCRWWLRSRFSDCHRLGEQSKSIKEVAAKEKLVSYFVNNQSFIEKEVNKIFNY